MKDNLINLNLYRKEGREDNKSLPDVAERCWFPWSHRYTQWYQCADPRLYLRKCIRCGRPQIRQFYKYYR